MKHADKNQEIPFRSIHHYVVLVVTRLSHFKKSQKKKKSDKQICRPARYTTGLIQYTISAILYIGHASGKCPSLPKKIKSKILKPILAEKL